jgi:hypothetical protein
MESVYLPPIKELNKSYYGSAKMVINGKLRLRVFFVVVLGVQDVQNIKERDHYSSSDRKSLVGELRKAIQHLLLFIIAGIINASAYALHLPPHCLYDNSARKKAIALSQLTV